MDLPPVVSREEWLAARKALLVSAFYRDGDFPGGRVCHTYSTYARGDDLLSTTYNYLDLTVLGRQDDGTGVDDFRYHDEY